MSHRIARLTFQGRCLLVRRVRDEGFPVAHVAKAMGISRQCAHKWVRRFDDEGVAGLEDRSSRPQTLARQTPPDVEDTVIAARREHRRGPEWLSWETGIPARTITAILRRNGLPRLYELDPMTGEVIRASKTTALRYERDRPGELVHVDVKKIGRIPDGGGWRAHSRAMGSTHKRKQHPVGYDFIHSMVDDHSRLAYSEIHPDERGDTCAGFIARAAQFFADHGIEVIERVMTDNHWSYRNSRSVAAVIADLGPNTSSSDPTSPGRTARSNASTAPCKPNGPTGTPSPQTTNAPPLWHHGSTTTTTTDGTTPSEATRPPDRCHQPHG